MFAISKRVLLFLLTNILIIATVTIIINLLGLDGALHQYGTDYTGLMIICLIWGTVGSLISLLLSKKMAKWMLGVHIIDPKSNDPRMQQLVQTVHRLSQAAGLGAVPDVGVYESVEVNAFATGPTKNNSLVAVSTGLLSQLKSDEVEGVLAHEVAHIANGDMVTMTLIQGVVNAFVMFLARVVARIVMTSLSRDRDSGFSPFAYFGIVMLLQIVFGILGSMVVAMFSRWREYRADAGGARLAGRGKMIAALEALKQTIEIKDKHMDEKQAAVAALKISSHKGGFRMMLATHPPLEHRIARLRGQSI